VILGVSSSLLAASCLDREGVGLLRGEGESEGRPNRMVITSTELEGHKEGIGGSSYRLQPGNVFNMRVVKGGKGLPRESM